MSDDIIKRLREALAAGPTPGRRFQGRSPHSYCVYDKRCWYEADGSRHGETPNLVVTISPEDAQADAQFIAAASPDNIRALLDRLDAADAENERLRAAVEALAAIVQAERVAKYQEQVRYKVSRSDSAKAALAEYDAALALADAALGNGTERAT